MKKCLLIVLGILMALTGCNSDENKAITAMAKFEDQFWANKDFMLTYEVTPDNDRKQMVYICDSEDQVLAMDTGWGVLEYFEDGKSWLRSESGEKWEAMPGLSWASLGDLTDPGVFRLLLAGLKDSAGSLLAKVTQDERRGRGFETSMVEMKQSMWNDFYGLKIDNLKKMSGPITVEEVEGDSNRLILRADRDMEFVDFSNPEEDVWDAVEVKLNVQDGILEEAIWFYQGQVSARWKLVANAEEDPLEYQDLLIDKYDKMNSIQASR